MKNQIIPLRKENGKVLEIKIFGFSDQQIIFSSKKHSSFESLLASVEKSGLMEEVKTVPIDSVTEINFKKKEKYFTIKYDKNGKTKKEVVIFQDLSVREAIGESIASLKQLERTVVKESKTGPLLWNLLGIISMPVFIWAFRQMAIDAQNGEQYTASGRNRGLKNLLNDIVEFVGPAGVTIIGILILIHLIYKTYTRYNNPDSIIKYVPISSNTRPISREIISEKKKEPIQNEYMNPERKEQKAFFEELRNNRDQGINSHKTTDHSKYFPKNDTPEV